MVVIVGIVAATVGFLLAYNYARFGAPFDFGLKYQV